MTQPPVIVLVPSLGCLVRGCPSPASVPGPEGFWLVRGETQVPFLSPMLDDCSQLTQSRCARFFLLQVLPCPQNICKSELHRRISLRVIYFILITLFSAN